MCRTEGTDETKGEGGFGIHALIEKAQGLFKTHEGREADAENEQDVHKLSEYIKKYLHIDVSPETIKSHLASLKAKLGVGSTPAPAEAPAPASS